MEIKKFSWVLFLVVVSLIFTSCLMDSGTSESYSESYGYVKDYDGTLYVATSTGYLITWDGISNELKEGQCITVTFTIDSSAGHTLSSSGVYYDATNVSYSTDLDSFTLSSESPIDQIDSNYVTSASVDMYYYTSWFGDNWYLYYTTKTTNGKTVKPVFYYSTSAADSFEVSTDSLIIDMRLQITGTRDTTTVTTSNYCAVDLSPIRTMFTTSGNYTGKYIPIYFRFYTAKKTTAKTGATTYGMYIGE